jgi:hypothetical protein
MFHVIKEMSVVPWTDSGTSRAALIKLVQTTASLKRGLRLDLMMLLLASPRFSNTCYLKPT